MTTPWRPGQVPPGPQATGEELLRARQRWGLSQQALGKAMGYHRASIQAYEAGVRPVPPKLATWALRVLGHAGVDSPEAVEPSGGRT